jgi:Ca2+-binding EF-hand superfamily protein
MSIGKINESSSPYPAIGAKSKAADSEAVAPVKPSTAGSSSSTIVTLSSGAISAVDEGSTTGLVGVPLAAAWAPQMLVQGDTNKDEQLDTDEFAAQLERAGLAAEQAKKLFDSFDTSSDGILSVDEFVDGVKASIDSGDTLFSKLADSYTRDADGNLNSSALKDFLEKGRALAEKYAQQSGNGRR